MLGGLLAILASAGAVLPPVLGPGGVGPADASIIIAGYDVSWPNCATSLPSPPSRFVIVGTDGGGAFTTNPCLRREWSWALRTPSPALYLNVGAPLGTTAWRGRTGPAGTCSATATLCRAYNYGYNAARAAYVYAARQLGGSLAVRRTWWLDVELGSHWSRSTSINARAIAGALSFLRSKGLPAGIYSTTYQFHHIAGTSYRPGVAVWYATQATSYGSAAVQCRSSSFTGGRVKLVQYTPGGLDHDLGC